MSEQRTQNRDPDVELSPPPHEQRGGLPAVVERAPARPKRRWRPRVMLIALLLMIGAGAGIGWLWWQQHQSRPAAGHRLRKWSPRIRRNRHRHEVCRAHREAFCR